MTPFTFAIFKISLKVCRRTLFKTGCSFDCCLLKSVLKAAVPEAVPAAGIVQDIPGRAEPGAVQGTQLLGWSGKRSL